MTLAFGRGREMPHRLHVDKFRADRWPLCPSCGDDELYSLTVPATPDTICGCYRCGPCEVVHPLPACAEVQHVGDKPCRRADCPLRTPANAP